MIVLSENYPPPQPNPHGHVFASFPAWDEALEFSRDNIAWPKGSDPEKRTALMVQDYVRQFYASRWFAESKWFRETFQHSVLILANQNGFQLRQIATRCADGIALVSFSEVDDLPRYSLDEGYHAKRLIEETLIMHREVFLN